MTTEVALLRFDGAALPRPLRGLPVVEGAGVDGYRRLIVVGSKADLADVLTNLMRTERLDVEVGFVSGRLGARRALTATARRVPSQFLSVFCYL